MVASNMSNNLGIFNFIPARVLRESFRGDNDIRLHKMGMLRLNATALPNALIVKTPQPWIEALNAQFRMQHLAAC